MPDAKIRKNVNSTDCVNCFTCVEKCPEDKCLTVRFAGLEIFESKYDKVYIPKRNKRIKKKCYGRKKKK